MSVLHTERNQVYAMDPLPDDSFVRTYLRAPEGLRLLTTQPIEQYKAAVDWAVGFADQMAMYIVVMPITTQEFLDSNRERLERGLAALNDQERGELRQVAVASMLTVMRDCPDEDTRAGAYEALQKLKVVP
jgi:hypothetical protein